MAWIKKTGLGPLKKIGAPLVSLYPSKITSPKGRMLLEFLNYNSLFVGNDNGHQKRLGKETGSGNSHRSNMCVPNRCIAFVGKPGWEALDTVIHLQ